MRERRHNSAYSRPDRIILENGTRYRMPGWTPEPVCNLRRIEILPCRKSKSGLQARSQVTTSWAFGNCQILRATGIKNIRISWTVCFIKVLVLAVPHWQHQGCLLWHNLLRKQRSDNEETEVPAFTYEPERQIFRTCQFPAELNPVYETSY